MTQEREKGGRLKKAIVITAALVLGLEVLAYLMPRYLVFAYGFDHNARFAAEVNKELLGRDIPSRGHLHVEKEFCPVSQNDIWFQKGQPSNCVVVKAAREDRCSFWTRGEQCVALNIPRAYGPEVNFMAALEIVVRKLISKHGLWYLNIAVEDVERVFVSMGEVVPERVQSHSSFPIFHRLKMLRMTRWSDEFETVGGPAVLCEVRPRKLCTFDQ